MAEDRGWAGDTSRTTIADAGSNQNV